MNSRITRTTEDGTDYDVLQTPAVVTLAPVSYSAESDCGDGYKFHHFFVRAEDIRKCGLPLDANPREPTRAKVVKEMAESLRRFPAQFHHWNNGITLVSDGVQHVRGTLEINFREGSGICNGGHTYFSIVTFPDVLPPECFVHVELIELAAALDDISRRGVINDIARRRNTNRALMPTTQADYLDYYVPFQQALGEHANIFAWHEGDSRALPKAPSSELLIRELACMDPFWFQHPVHSAAKSNHKQAGTSSASLHAKWFENQGDPHMNLLHMAPLSMEIVDLAEYISYDLETGDFKNVTPKWRATNFYKDWIAKEKVALKIVHPGVIAPALPAPALMMMLGAFRSNVWVGLDEDGEPIFSGFLRQNRSVWDQVRDDLLRQLTNLFDDSDKDPNHFIKTSAPYDLQTMSLLFGKQAPSYPEIFHDLRDGAIYDRDAVSPTHWLESDTGCFAELRELGATESGVAAEQKYRKRVA